jgi:AcrR family transcriptional regulator
VLQSGGTRDAIVRAALECAASGNWEATSLHAVRQRAGVSNGSLFHHFPTRQALDAALVAAALEQHQEALLAQLSPDPDPEAAEAAVVRRHLQWVQDDPEVARLLLHAPPDVLRAAVTAPALESNRAFFHSVGTWLERHGWSGRPGLFVVLALWIGPAQEYSRQWLAGPRATALLDVADDLAEGARAALVPLLGDTSTTTPEDLGDQRR